MGFLRIIVFQYLCELEYRFNFFDKFREIISYRIPYDCKFLPPLAKLETAILSNAESSPFDIITSSTERRTPK